MDLKADLLRQLDVLQNPRQFLEGLLQFGAGRTRCPHGAAYLKESDSYTRIAACGRGRDLPDSIFCLFPTGRNVRNVHLPGDDPARPPAFLRLEWDGPQIHDPEAVEALEAACVDAAVLLAGLPKAAE